MHIQKSRANEQELEAWKILDIDLQVFHAEWYPVRNGPGGPILLAWKPMGKGPRTSLAINTILNAIFIMDIMTHVLIFLIQFKHLRER